MDHREENWKTPSKTKNDLSIEMKQSFLEMVGHECSEREKVGETGAKRDSVDKQKAIKTT